MTSRFGWILIGTFEHSPGHILSENGSIVHSVQVEGNEKWTLVTLDSYSNLDTFLDKVSKDQQHVFFFHYYMADDNWLSTVY